MGKDILILHSQPVEGENLKNMVAELNTSGANITVVVLEADATNKLLYENFDTLITNAMIDFNLGQLFALAGRRNVSYLAIVTMQEKKVLQRIFSSQGVQVFHSDQLMPRYGRDREDFEKFVNK
jgi:hypothetical protein